MKTLKDVYIKVTKQNKEDLDKIAKFDIPIGKYVCFVHDVLSSVYYYSNEPEDKQKVSLSELKRLIDTTPTRDEIKRLKAQLSAYKMNLKNAQFDIESLKNTIKIDLIDNNRYLKQLNTENTNLRKINKEYHQTNKNQKECIKNQYEIIKAQEETVRNFRYELSKYTSKRHFKIFGITILY